MRVSLVSAVLISVLVAGGNLSADTAATQKELAEQFLRGIYGCNSAVVDELAAADIVVTYPVFEKLFGTAAIRGRDAVKRFAVGFCERWGDAEITVHEAIAENDRVVLVWSYRARNVGSASTESEAAAPEHAWGGISLYRFDREGKIVAEIGEESEPGPIERLKGEGASR